MTAQQLIKDLRSYLTENPQPTNETEAQQALAVILTVCQQERTAA